MSENEGRVNLETERLRVDASWRAQGAEYVALPVAAAIAFHQAHRSTKAIVTVEDYDDALNIAASALSRLIPILVVNESQSVPVKLDIDLARQRFSRGATRLVGNDGTAVMDLPFSLAFMPVDDNAERAPQGSTSPEERESEDRG